RRHTRLSRDWSSDVCSSDLGNAILPLYFKLFSKKRYSGKSMGGDRKIIVSFTTFPKRIDSIWKVIECMLRQTVRPDKVMLYLSRSEERRVGKECSARRSKDE